MGDTKLMNGATDSKGKNWTENTCGGFYWFRKNKVRFNMKYSHIDWGSMKWKKKFQ